MTKRLKSSLIYFDYVLEKYENIFICNIENLAIGISENNYKEAIEDAKQKLYYLPNLQCNHKKNNSQIIIDYDDYIKFHKSQIDHILL